MARQPMFAVLLAAVLMAGCGNSANQVDPNAATTDTSTVGGDPGGDLSTDPSLDASSLGTTDPSGSTDPSLSASPTPTPLANGYTLKGLVTDGIGKPLPGAQISIGSQTTLSGNDGTFSITNIMDSQVRVEVSLNGYQPISNYVVAFSNDAAVADKEFKLATADASATTGGTTTTTTTDGTTTTTTTTPTAGFTLATTIAPVTFKTVSAMAVDGDVAYILGSTKDILFNHNTVVELNAITGQMITKFNKVGLLSYIPTTATHIAAANNQVQVSDGATTYTFAPAGTVIKKTSGSLPNPTNTVVDSQRGITYHLNGATKMDVTYNGGITTYTLPSAQSAVSLGLDSRGDVLVLDALQSAVLQYTFTTP